uniref:Sugar transferase, PEP-CTERM/EpsH1 system associated n=1 Tax=Desulfovibrio sp. U5L TaxID=596152 RepID=I2Q331_9BACT
MSGAMAGPRTALAVAGGGLGREILVLCHRIPYPPNKGDKVRSYHLVRHLAERGWRVHLGALADTPGDMAYRDSLRPLCASLAVEPLPAWRKCCSLLGAVRGTSLSVECFRNRRLQAYVDKVLASGTVSAALAVSAPMAEYLRCAASPLPGRRILDLVDVDSEKWRAYAGRAAWPASQIYGLEAKLLGRYEQRAADLFEAVLLVSEAEVSLFRSLGGRDGQVRNVSNGVDLDYFSPAPDRQGPSASPSTVFCGAMDYPPNIDAVAWFAESVLPRLRRRLRRPASFSIVGSNPAPRVRALAGLPGVGVTGAVPDVRPFVAEAAVSVAPMRIARGVQNKVLEAMAMGKAVVATEQAFEGIEAVAGEDLCVVPDEPEAFAAAVAGLLADPAGAAAMGRRARRRMERHYAWAARLKTLEELLR